MTQARTEVGRRRAFLVVDVQRDFCPGGALPASGGNRILPAINRYLIEAQERAMPIYASRDWHPAVTTHFQPFGGKWPPHCVQGSEGAEFHPQLDLPASTIIVSKGEDPERSGYSAFDGYTSEGQPFLTDLRHRRVDVLYITGLTTEYCVKQTTLDALRAGLHVIVLTDAIAGIDAQPGDADRALAEMARAGADLTTGFAADAGASQAIMPQAPDVVLLGVDWQPRALLRAQLIEEGFEVVATDAWPITRQQLRPGIQPRLVLVDLKGLPDPDGVLNELGMLIEPDRVLILTASGTVPPADVERLGFHALSRPVEIEEVVRAAASAIRFQAPTPRITPHQEWPQRKRGTSMQIDLRREDAVILRDLLRERIMELDKEINRTDTLDFKHELQQLERTIERVIGQLSTALDRPEGSERPAAQK